MDEKEKFEKAKAVEYIRQVVLVSNLSESTATEIFNLFEGWQEGTSDEVIAIIGYKKGTTLTEVIRHNQVEINEEAVVFEEQEKKE